MTFIPFPSIDTCVFIPVYATQTLADFACCGLPVVLKTEVTQNNMEVRTHVNKIGGLFAAVKSTIDRSYLLFTILYGRYIARS